jgi:hypothetical protein
MAKDPSKKGIRKIPEGFLDWIEDTYNKETRTWYKTNAGKSKAFATKTRINLSEEAGQVGAYHEGHFQGAKDVDVEQGMGGGPTTGRTMRSEIGVLNVAHAEKPRIPKRDMRRLGIPQYWLEDFYEALLEAEGQKVIGNLDEQAAMDIDAGMPVAQAEAQSRMRDDLRRQGVDIPGARPTYQNKPAPLPAEITEQAIPPEFDLSDIKKTGEVKVKPRTSRVPQVPQNPVEFVNGFVKYNAGFGLGALDALKRNLPGAALGAATAIDTETIKGVQEGDYGKVAMQTALGTALGTAAQQAVTGSATILGQAQRFAALGQIPGGLKIAAGAAKIAPPVMAGVAGYQLLDAITYATTGKTLQETGQAAEQTKEELRQQGMSEYQLRKKARTGRF